LKKIILIFAAVMSGLSLYQASSGLAADKMKIMYHVSELDKVPFVLGNMLNHIKDIFTLGLRWNVDIKLCR